MPAPRQLARSKWGKEHGPRVARYHCFRDHVRILGVEVPERCELVFELPVPASGRDRIGKPHQQKPDLDNLVKGLLDAVFKDDAHVYKILAEKRWAKEGAIWVRELS